MAHQRIRRKHRVIQSLNNQAIQVLWHALNPMVELNLVLDHAVQGKVKLPHFQLESSPD